MSMGVLVLLGSLHVNMLRLLRFGLTTFYDCSVGQMPETGTGSEAAIHAQFTVRIPAPLTSKKMGAVSSKSISIRECTCSIAAKVL
jgi:hypothetical protein